MGRFGITVVVFGLLVLSVAGQEPVTIKLPELKPGDRIKVTKTEKGKAGETVTTVYQRDGNTLKLALPRQGVTAVTSFQDEKALVANGLDDGVRHLLGFQRARGQKVALALLGQHRGLGGGAGAGCEYQRGQVGRLTIDDRYRLSRFERRERLRAGHGVKAAVPKPAW